MGRRETGVKDGVRMGVTSVRLTGRELTETHYSSCTLRVSERISTHDTGSFLPMGGDQTDHGRVGSKSRRTGSVDPTHAPPWYLALRTPEVSLTYPHLDTGRRVFD